eukprot:SAG31_NODE_1003_length_10447_cov_3.491593_10_plen_114_part_00
MSLRVLPTGLQLHAYVWGANGQEESTEGQFLPYEQMASYDTGGALGKSGMNSLLIMMKVMHKASTRQRPCLLPMRGCLTPDRSCAAVVAWVANGYGPVWNVRSGRNRRPDGHQ